MPCRSRSVLITKGHHGSSPNPARTVINQSSTRTTVTVARHLALRYSITLRVTSTHYGPRKACTLRDRCTPSICRSGWRQAVYRFCVRTLSLHLLVELSPSSLMHSPDTEFISNPTLRSFTEQYLGFGETVFNAIQGTAVTSPYFKRNDRPQ